MKIPRKLKKKWKRQILRNLAKLRVDFSRCKIWYSRERGWTIRMKE